MLANLLWIGLAGALGTFARHGLAGVAQRACSGGFPCGTLAVNVLGCFLFGLIWSAAETRWPLAPEVRTAVFVGFMGAFTTFSSFAFETAELLRAAQWTTAAANVLAQNLVGLLGLFLGLYLGRL